MITIRELDLEALASTFVAQKDAGDELTIRPNSVTERPQGAPSAIPEVEPSKDFELRGLLGEGGLGKVQVYWQKSLKRELAVKSVKDDQLNEFNLKALVEEAQITGALQHPGVLPVHVLLQTSDGQPGFAMKKAESLSKN